MKTGPLKGELSLWGFEGDVFVFRDGSTGFAFEYSGADIACRADDAINGISTQLVAFLNSLPSGIDIQFMQEIAGGNEGPVEAFRARASQAASGPASELAAARSHYFAELDAAGYLPKLRSYLFVRRPFTEPLVKKAGLFSSDSKFIRLSEERLTHEVSLAEGLARQIESELNALGLSYKRMTSLECFEMLYAQWNPGRSVPAAKRDISEYLNGEDIAAQLLFSSVEIKPTGFRIGDVSYRIISLKLLPEQTIACMSAALNALPFGSRLFVSVQVSDQQKELESLQRSRRVAYSMVVGQRAGVSDIESRAKLTDIESLLEEMIAANEKVFRVSLHVLLKGKDEAELAQRVRDTLLAIRHMAGAEGMEETLAAFEIFSEFAIPNARGRERARRLKSSNLADLLPIFAPWPGHSTASILLRSREGSLVSFDPFDPGLTNSNQLVSGGSGAGKSFLANLLLLQMLKENPKVFFVDIGGSYKKLTENLSGQYVALDVGSGLSLNPFDLADGETTPSSHKIKFLVALVELMTKEEGDARLPKLHRAEVEDAIARVYEVEARPRLSTLQKLLLEHGDPEISRYGRILSTWCGDTPFGQFIDRETTITLNRPLVAFDLKGLDSYADLQAVCLFIITDFVWREVGRDRVTPKFLVFDECWKLLKNDAGLAFIEETFRTFRKYRASAVAISQDMEDFARSKIASAILPNCSIKWVLPQNQIDFARLKETLSLNDNEIELIKSLRQKKGYYSEAFLMAQDHHTTVMIESTPFEYWIATTDPRDLALIEADQKSRPDDGEFDRLKRLAESYPHGVAAAQAGAVPGPTSESKGGAK